MGGEDPLQLLLVCRGRVHLGPLPPLALLVFAALFGVGARFLGVDSIGSNLCLNNVKSFNDIDIIAVLTSKTFVLTCVTKSCPKHRVDHLLANLGRVD